MGTTDHTDLNGFLRAGVDSTPARPSSRWKTHPHSTRGERTMTEYAVLLPGDESAWEARRGRGADRHLRPARGVLPAPPEKRGHRITGGAEADPFADRQGSPPYPRRRARRHRRSVCRGRRAARATTSSSDDLDDLLEICAVLASVDGGVEGRASVDHGEEAS